jgi:acyl-CoA thioesterase-2
MGLIDPHLSSENEALDRMPALAWDGRDIAALLALDPQGDDAFVSRRNQRNVNGALYGGQVVAQALCAATATTGGRPLHSLHSYFLRPGSTEFGVLYRVERLREGLNFTTRRVTAWQADKQLLELTCSYANRRQGFEHQTPMPDVPQPEALEAIAEAVARCGDTLPPYLQGFIAAGPVDLALIDKRELTGATGLATRNFWFRAPGAGRITDPGLAAAVIAYISDFWLASAALTPHTMPSPHDGLFVASLDHCIWFHRPVAAPGDWLLYSLDSPSAREGINLSRGLIFDRRGALVASTAQEALQLPDY